MANKVIGNQLVSVANLYKTTLRSLIQKDNGYIVPEDFAGAWTTGYIADTGLFTKEEASTEAKLLHLKNKLSRYVTEENENKPKLAQIMPQEEGEPVADVMSDFRDSENVKLISENKVAWVKGRYLAHFINSYAGCEFRLYDSLKPIKVIRGEDTLGLIMPVRMEEV